MPRGIPSKLGDTHVAANGYHYTRTERGWRLTHHILAEEVLGREIDTEAETVRFRDGVKENLTTDNIIVVPKRRKTNARRLAEIRARIENLKAQESELLS